MSYFNKILGGKIPLNIVQLMNKNEKKYKLSQDFSYYKIKEGDDDILMLKDINGIMQTKYGSIINKSLELSRDKMLEGLNSLIFDSLKAAVEINKDQILNIGLVDLEQYTSIIYTVRKTFSEYFLSEIKKININHNLFNLHIILVYLSGITGDSLKSIDDISKQLALDLEIGQNFIINTFIDINQPFIDILTPCNIKSCGPKLDFTCLFNDLFINKLASVILNIWEIILNDIISLSHYKKVINIYTFSVEFADAIYNLKYINFKFQINDDDEKILTPLPKINDDEKILTLPPDLQINDDDEKILTPPPKINDDDKLLTPPPKIQINDDENTEIIEGFLDVGNSTKIKDTTKIKDLKEIDKKIDQSKVIKGLTNMLSSAVTNAVNKNTAELLRSIAASNKISVGSAKGGSYSFKKVKQTNIINQETNANFVQNVSTKVINDISAKLQENIDVAAKQASSDTKKLTSDEKTGTSIGDMLNSVANIAGQAIDATAKLLSISAGNSMNQDTTKDINQQLKDSYSLDQSFKYEKNDDVKSSLQNILSTENLSKCAASTDASNITELGNIDVSGPIDISDLDQSNIVNDVMNCAFNQSIMNDIANKIFNDYNKLITQMVENVDTKLDEQTKSKVQGDIYAAGVAGAAVLQAAGESISTASQGVGKGIESAGSGVSTAAKGVGEGVSTAAKGIGEGIGSVMGGFMTPIIIGGVILIILIIGFVIFKNMGTKSNSDNDNDNGDEE